MYGGDGFFVFTDGVLLLPCQSHVYAVGGNDGIASLSSVERFDPHLNKWTDVKEMGQRRAGNGVSELNGCLYVVGERRSSRASARSMFTELCHSHPLLDKHSNRIT